MLSPDTLKELEALQEGSDGAYPEGGLLYTYIEAANQAHCRYNGGSNEKTLLQLQEGDLKELGRFLQISQGAYGQEKVDPPYIQQAQLLLDNLKRDLSFDETYATFDDNGTDIEAVVHMARRRDNRYFCLELWWSVD
jgi:hypothetical protein